MIIYVFEIYPFKNIYLIKKACNNFLCLIVHKVCVYIIHILFLYSLVAKQLFLLNFLWHCERESRRAEKMWIKKIKDHVY